MRKIIPKLIALVVLLFINAVHAQQGYWQQQADYVMEVDMDVDSYRYTGTQLLTYTNNSPDSLYRVF